MVPESVKSHESKFKVQYCLCISAVGTNLGDWHNPTTCQIFLTITSIAVSHMLTHCHIAFLSVTLEYNIIIFKVVISNPCACPSMTGQL